jgi:hypothetical protein
MPLRRAPHQSGVHRIAAIALYRALLTQCAAIPLAQPRLDEIRNIIRNRFRAQRHTVSSRHLHVYFDAGYEALDHLDAARAGIHESTAYIDALVETAPFWMKRSLKTGRKEEHGKPRNRPLRPIDLSALAQWEPIPIYRPTDTEDIQPDAQLQDFFSERLLQEGNAANLRIAELNGHEAATPCHDTVFNRPLRPDRLKGKRRVPKLVSANLIPTLRMGKPQPPALSGYIAHRIASRQARVERSQRLQQEKDLGLSEDRWDSLMAELSRSDNNARTGREPSWSSAVSDSLHAEAAASQRERAKSILIGQKMNLVIEAEQAALDLENAVAKREKRDKRFRQWLDRHLQRQKKSSEDSTNEVPAGVRADVPSDEAAALPPSSSAPTQSSDVATELARPPPDTVEHSATAEYRPLTKALPKSSPLTNFKPTRPLKAFNDLARDSFSGADTDADLEAARIHRGLGPNHDRAEMGPTKGQHNNPSTAALARRGRMLVEKCRVLKHLEELTDGGIAELSRTLESHLSNFETLWQLVLRQNQLQKDMDKFLTQQIDGPKPAEDGDTQKSLTGPMESEALVQADMEERLKQQRLLQQEIIKKVGKCAKLLKLQKTVTSLKDIREKVKKLRLYIGQVENKYMFRTLDIKHDPTPAVSQAIPVSEFLEQASAYGADVISSLNQQMWLKERKNVTMADAFDSPTAIRGPGYFRALDETLAQLGQLSKLGKRADQAMSFDFAQAERIQDVQDLYIAMADVLRKADFSGLEVGRASSAKLREISEEEREAAARAEAAERDEKEGEEGEGADSSGGGAVASPTKSRDYRRSRFMNGWKRQALNKKDLRVTEVIELQKKLRAFRKVNVPDFTLESMEVESERIPTREFLFPDDEHDDDYGEEN